MPEALFRAGEVAFTPVFQANFLTVPGTILYNQANCRIFGNHRRGSAEFFQFQQARPVEAQTDRLLLSDCLKRNAADEESQSLDYKNLLPGRAALDSEYRASAGKCSISTETRSVFSFSTLRNSALRLFPDAIRVSSKADFSFSHCRIAASTRSISGCLRERSSCCLFRIIEIASAIVSAPDRTISAFPADGKAADIVESYKLSVISYNYFPETGV